MSVYAEYRNAKTDEEREAALVAMKWEAAREAYFDKMAEEKMDNLPCKEDGDNNDRDSES